MEAAIIRCRGGRFQRRGPLNNREEARADGERVTSYAVAPPRPVPDPQTDPRMLPTPVPDPAALALALGRLPTGLYVATTVAASGAPLGFVASFVMQTGFAPPTLCVAMAKDRAHLAAVRAAGLFALSILDESQSGPLMGPFLRKTAPGHTQFDRVKARPAPSGALVLDDALAWLDCRVVGEFDSGDHVVVFGQITAGAILRAGEPAIHLRKNGLRY